MATVCRSEHIAPCLVQIVELHTHVAPPSFIWQVWCVPHTGQVVPPASPASHGRDARIGQLDAPLAAPFPFDNVVAGCVAVGQFDRPAVVGRRVTARVSPGGSTAPSPEST